MGKVRCTVFIVIVAKFKKLNDHVYIDKTHSHIDSFLETVNHVILYLSILCTSFCITIHFYFPKTLQRSYSWPVPTALCCCLQTVRKPCWVLGRPSLNITDKAHFLSVSLWTPLPEHPIRLQWTPNKYSLYCVIFFKVPVARNEGLVS